MQKPSPFAAILRRMLDESNTFNREEWATIVNTETWKIELYVSDKAFPSAEVFRSILSVLKEDTRVPADILADYKILASKPLDEVTPLSELALMHCEKIGRTLNHYENVPLLHGFFRTLSTVTPEQQLEVLYDGAEMCRRLRRQ